MGDDRTLGHTKHVIRAMVLLVALIVALVLGRTWFVPESWGESGWYRAEAVTEHRALEIRHAGDEACADCHDEVGATHDAGAHVSVRCELCHAVLTEHVRDGEVVAEMPIAASLELCGRCHRELNARPEDFPQVNISQHLEMFDLEPADDVCTECHDPHSPADL